jgi:hypothetical protein
MRQPRAIPSGSLPGGRRLGPSGAAVTPGGFFLVLTGDREVIDAEALFELLNDSMLSTAECLRQVALAHEALDKPSGNAIEKRPASTDDTAFVGCYNSVHHDRH